MIKIGHRGARRVAMENTLYAIKMAMDSGLDSIEFDLCLTKDKHLVLHHDQNLNRMYGLDVDIKDKTLKELFELTKNKKHQIASFIDAMKLVRSYPVCIELKDEGSAEILLHDLERFPDANVFRVISFKKQVLIDYKKLGGTSPTWIIADKHNWPLIIFTAKKIGAIGFAAHRSCLIISPLHILWMRWVGLEFAVYPINSRIFARIFRFLNPNSYLIGDYPKKLVKF